MLKVSLIIKRKIILFIILTWLLFSGSAAQAFVFNSNFKAGDTRIDVKELQKFLNSNNFLISKSGAGSPGKETEYFGALTKQALASFQKSQGITSARGFFGPVTRAIINRKIAERKISEFVIKAIQAFAAITAPSYSIGGSITGLVGSVTLLNNNGDSLVIMPSDGANFVFPSRISDGASYNISVLTGHPDQKCYTYLNTGNINGHDIKNIKVACGLSLSYDPFKYAPPSGSSQSSNEDDSPTPSHIPSVSEVGTVADNGATIPLFGSIREAAFYINSLDTTVFAWEAFADGRRQAQVSTYNHTTETFGPIVDSGITTLISDDHGVPAMVQDYQGYGHLFGGAHGGSMQYAVTSAPNDFSSWASSTPITGG